MLEYLSVPVSTEIADEHLSVVATNEAFRIPREDTGAKGFPVRLVRLLLELVLPGQHFFS